MVFLRQTIVFFFITFLKIFTRTRVRYGAKIPPNLFFQLIKNRKWKVSLDQTLFGRGVKLSNGNRFYYNPEIFGNVEMGSYTSVSGPSTRICAKKNWVKIGKFCSIASGVVIQEYYHSMNTATSYNILSNIFNEPESDKIISKGNIIIEDDVWIGSNSVILSGVTIGRGSIIGAGSIVTKDVGKYEIVAGNPAKFLRNRFSQKTINELENSMWWDWPKKRILNERDFFTKKRN